MKFFENLGDKVFFWYVLSYFIIIKLFGVGDEGYRVYRLDWLFRYNIYWNKEIKYFKFYEFWYILNYWLVYNNCFFINWSSWENFYKY